MDRQTRFRDLRRKHRMTQRQMAAKIGVSQSNYGRYESGLRQPDGATLIKIADEFGVSIDYLIGRCDTPYYVYSGEALAPAPESVLDETTEVETDPVAWLPKTQEEFEKYIIELIGRAKN